MGLWGLLREWFQGGSGVGVRVVLGWPWNVFSSWAYASVCSPEIEGLGNLTGDLTEVLTDRLTGYLPRGLTNRGHQRVERAGKLAQDTAWRPWRRWVSASDSTLLTTE